MRNRSVNQQTEKEHEKDISGKPDPFGNRSNHQRGGNHRELHLEKGEEQQGDGWRKAPWLTGGYIFKKEECGWVSDKSANRISKGKAKTYNYPDHTDESGGNKTLKHGGDYVLSVHHSSIKER